MKSSFALLLVTVLLSCVVLMHVGTAHAAECPPPDNCALFDGSWTKVNSCACVYFRGISPPMLLTVVNPSKQVGSISYRVGSIKNSSALQSSFPDGFVNTFTLEKTENMNVIFQNDGTQTIELALYYPGSPAIGYFVKGQVPQLQNSVALNMEPLSSAMRSTGTSYEIFNFCASAHGKIMTYANRGGMKTMEFDQSGCKNSEPRNYMGSLVYIVNISKIKGATIRVTDQVL